MSLVREDQRSWFERCACSIVQQGSIPRHVAFIMDGNRRYADSRKLARRSEGHSLGFDKLAEALQWCAQLGVNQVTVYAFSIDNFRRPADEVETLMQLARQKLARVLDEQAQLRQHGVRLRVWGRLDMLSDDLRKLIDDVHAATADNSKCLLNVCMAYTSRDEMTAAINRSLRRIDKAQLGIDELDEIEFERSLYSGSSKPDLLIRTSGEARLSDFLLWQVNKGELIFVDALWPDFTLWHLLAAIVCYQRRRN